MKKEVVSIVKCSSYEQETVDKAVEKSLKNIGFDLSDYKHKKVLIKPNIIGYFPRNQAAITTHPAVVEAVCKILKKNKCKIIIGESPFTEPEISFKASKIDKVAKKYNAKLIIFEQEKLTTIRDEKARVLKKFQIARILKDVDLIINMPKLKTHVLTKYTGAIKNLYGCIPGGLKQKTHLKVQGEKKFSKALIDIYQNIKPRLNIMDGVIGMEGNGPTSGNPKKAGLILASRNTIALDIAATKIIGINPKRIYAIKEALKRKLYRGLKFDLVGLKKLPLIKFKPPTPSQREGIQGMLNKRFREKPIICDKTLCVRCGKCARHCPAKAITLNPYPTTDRKKCIRCFCCIEICPQDALSLEK